MYEVESNDVYIGCIVIYIEVMLIHMFLKMWAVSFFSGCTKCRFPLQ